MATLSEVRQHKQAVEDLVTLALRDLREFWRSLGLEDPRQIASAVRAFLPELTGAYALATSTLAADWYEDLRAETALTSAFTAAALEAPSPDEVQNELGYVLAPLFSGGVAADVAPGETFQHLTALVEDVVTTADRQTVRANMAVDRGRPRYARHASANACAFCALLATRGAEYTSEESAARVVLSSSRNRRSLGERYHDNCRCIAVPVWESKTYEEAPYVANWREAYYDATAQVGTKDLSAILSLMRQTLDTN